MSAARHPQAHASLPKRLWLYQAERFPLLKTMILLLVFTFAGISVSAQLAGRALPDVWAFSASWVVAIAIFFQMRVCDEWKDEEIDRRFRPERPVPSGLISLRALSSIGMFSAVIALIAVYSVSTALVWLLMLVWIWLTLMTVEFLAPATLKASPFLYLTTHMMIMPFIDLLVTGFEWMPADGEPPSGLWIFLALSFVNGCVLEIGRKLWAPEKEGEGLESYSGLLGSERASVLWIALVFAAFVLTLVMGMWLDAILPVFIAAVIGLAVALWGGWQYRSDPSPKTEKFVDLLSAGWVFLCYFVLGIVALIWGTL